MPLDLRIAVCSHRVVSAATCHSFENLRVDALQNKLGFSYSLALFTGDALIGRSRSQACTKFLREFDDSYLLFIDDDIIFDPIHVKKIYEHLRNGYDVIGGIYPVRGATQLSSYGWDGHLEVNGGIHNIEYLATGFMGISRRILERMRDELKLPLLNPNDWAICYPFFECGRWTSRTKGDPIYISEDWEFCEKVRQVGGGIFTDTSVQLGHIREQVFTPNDVQQLQQKSYMEQEIYGGARSQGKILSNIIEDLSEFLHIPQSAVKDRASNAQPFLAAQWEAKTGSTEDFYKGNEEYLFDLATFNCQDYYLKERLGGILSVRNSRVLDIGCGIGTAVFVMTEHNNKVTGWDINEKCIKFARFKKKKYKLKGDFTTAKPDYGEFDLITAIDVLEHIEDLRGFLMELGKGMKRGAKLYHSDWFCKMNYFPMHFEENEKHLSEWLEEAGFVEWDKSWAVHI